MLLKLMIVIVTDDYPLSGYSYGFFSHLHGEVAPFQLLLDRPEIVKKNDFRVGRILSTQVIMNQFHIFISLVSSLHPLAIQVLPELFVSIFAS